MDDIKGKIFVESLSPIFIQSRATISHAYRPPRLAAILRSHRHLRPGYRHASLHRIRLPCLAVELSRMDFPQRWLGHDLRTVRFRKYSGTPQLRKRFREPDRLPVL